MTKTPKRWTHAAVLAGLVVAAASAQQQPDSSPPKRVDITGAVEVPISLETGLPIVDLLINGRGPLRFGIETGANFVAMTPDAAKRIGLAPSAGSDSQPTYHADAIAIGGATFGGVPIATVRPAQGGIDGILGLSLYQDLLLTLDYPGRRLRLERGELPPPDGQSILALSHVGPFWGAPIDIAGKRFTAVIDTRSTGGLGLTPESAESITFDGGLQVVGRARGAGIPEVEVKAGRLAGDVTLGRYRIVRPTIGVRPLPPGYPTEPLIGTRLLSQFVVTLDQRNGRLRLERAGDAAITLEEGLRRAAVGAESPGSTGQQEYAGRYGARTLFIEAGRLMLQREGGPPLEMVETARDTFTLRTVPQAQIKFVRDPDGRITAVQILNRDGQWETEQRAR